MKQTKKITKTLEVEEVEDVLCNKCGNSCLTYDGGESFKEFDGLIEVELGGGYHSKKLGDMTGYRFSLCETCLSELFATFKIPVDMKDYSFTDWIPADKFEAHLDELHKAFNTDLINE